MTALPSPLVPIVPPRAGPSTEPNLDPDALWAHCEPRLRVNSRGQTRGHSALRHYRSVLRHLARFAERHGRPLLHLTPDDARLFLAQAWPRHRTLTARRQEHHRARAIFRALRDAGLTGAAPFDDSPVPGALPGASPDVEGALTSLSDALLDRTGPRRRRAEQEAALLLVLLLTPLNVREALALRCRDLDVHEALRASPDLARALDAYAARIPRRRPASPLLPFRQTAFPRLAPHFGLDPRAALRSDARQFDAYPAALSPAARSRCAVLLALLARDVPPVHDRRTGGTARGRAAPRRRT